MRPRGDFKLPTTQNISTRARRNQKLRCTTGRTAQGRHGVVSMESVVGFVTVAATPAEQQDGTNDGASRCGRRWIICVMRTYLTLKRRAGLCSSIRGLREMTASHWFSIPNIRANNFSLNTPAAGFLRDRKSVV